MKKHTDELERKDCTIYFRYNHNDDVEVVNIAVYVNFLKDWVDIPADELTINQLNDLTNEVKEWVLDNPKVKEYNADDFI